MTPKKKAIDLTNKMMLGSKDRLYLRLAKQCSLIAVDEILTYNTFWDIKISNRPEDTEEFWIEVKLEIEKL
ncbi:MAG: hypothetical protein RIR01_1949 [Bacteroidota bacterium]|jgi:hypothetical protein